MNLDISDSCYKGTILQRNYRKMTIKWPFSYNTFVKFHGKIFWEPHDCFFVCFVALRPKSKATVMARRSAHLTTLFSWASLNKQLTSTLCTYFCFKLTKILLNDSAEGRRMIVEIISYLIFTKGWDLAGIKLVTPGSAVRLPSVARHVTNCAMWPVPHDCVTELYPKLCYNKVCYKGTTLYLAISTLPWKAFCEF